MENRWRRAWPLRWSAWWALLAGLLLQVAAGSYRTKEDDEASELAEQRAEEMCGKMNLDGIDLDSGRESLESIVGSENFVLDALVAAEDTDQLQDKLQEMLSPSWIIFTAGPVVFGFILVIVWLFCCWTACPCCKCCRCCSKQRRTSLWLRIVMMVLLSGVLLGMVICAFLAYRGKGDIEDGLYAVSCTAARVLTSTLNGNPEQKFIGVLPFLDVLGDLRSTLDGNSVFITSVFDIVDNTEEIERATVMAQQSTALLAATMALPANLNPPTLEAGRRELHRCELCAALADPVSELSTGLAEGLPTVLAAARREVERQLDSSSRESLRRTFDTAVAPLRDMATQVRDTANIVLSAEFKQYQEAGITGTTVFVVTISVVVLVVVFPCACSSGVLCLVKEYSSDKADEMVNPWNRAIPTCACCTWCWGWLYAILVFYFGGFMILLSVPLSGVCLLMEDLDSGLLHDVLPAVGAGLDASSSEFGMLTEVIDSCFSLQSPPTNKSLLDIIYTEEDSGTKVTMSERIKGQTVNMINAKFKDINNQLTATPPAFLGSPEMTSVLNLFRDMAVDAATLTQPEVSNHAAFSGLFLDPRAPNGMTAAVGSSLACNDFDVGGATAMGLTNLSARVAGFSSLPLVPTVPPIPCSSTGTVICNRDPSDGSPMTCPTIGGNSVCSACQAANSFMQLKAELVNANTYRCDIMETASGADCDPKDMVKVGAVWQNDCVQEAPNGDMFTVVKEKPCTLAEFKTYTAEWSTRLEKVFTRVDEAVPLVTTRIATDLQDLVDREIVKPVEGLVDSVQCNFLKVEYGNLVDGFCYQGVLGFNAVAKAYVWNGALTVFLVAQAYAIWRRAVDNVRGWKLSHGKVGPAEVRGCEVTVVPMDKSGKPLEGTVGTK